MDGQWTKSKGVLTQNLKRVNVKWRKSVTSFKYQGMLLLFIKRQSILCINSEFQGWSVYFILKSLINLQITVDQSKSVQAFYQF